VTYVIYECGCTAGGDLISPYCPIHSNMPIVHENENKKEYIMTQENKETETEFDVRQIRPTVQFVPGKQDTTEIRLKDIRERMTFTKAKNTIRRTGWYFTESYTPCGMDHYPRMGKENIGV